MISTRTPGSTVDLILRLADEHLTLMISNSWADRPRRAEITKKLQELRRCCPLSWEAAGKVLNGATPRPCQGGPDVDR